MTHHSQPKLPPSRSARASSDCGQDTTSRRPVPRQSTTESYTNLGQHAQQGGTINNFGSQPRTKGLNHPWFREENRQRSPPREASYEEGFNPPPRNPIPRPRPGSQSPRRDEPESVARPPTSAVRSTSIRSASSPKHSEFGLSPGPGLDEELDPPPRNSIPQPRPDNQSPRKNEFEYSEPHPSTSPVRPTSIQSAPSLDHPEPTPSPAVANNAATSASSGSGLQHLEITAGKSIPNPLHDNADEELFSVCRDGKTDALYKIIQTEIRYGNDQTEVPYSILGFRLERGEDRKRCLEVKLTGSFTQNHRYKNVSVKQLHHIPSKENTLAELQIQKNSTGQSQIQVGFNGKPVALVTISGLSSTQYTVTKGQKITSRFNDSQAGGTFGLTLALDDGVEQDSDLSVAESVFFFIMLRLEKDRQPLQLNLNADVKYATKRPWFGSKSKVVSNSFPNGYSGRASHDIIKN